VLVSLLFRHPSCSIESFHPRPVWVRDLVEAFWQRFHYPIGRFFRGQDFGMGG
jgi:hypothetical protein